MKPKSLQIIAVLVMLVMSLSAGVVTQAQDSVELEFWIYSDYATGIALDMQNTFIEEFEAANPDITINLVAKPGTDIQAGLIAGAASGELPDVFTHGLGNTSSYIELDLLVNIMPMWEAMPEEYRAQFDPEVVAMAQPADDVMYGLPYTGYAQLLYRNWTVLEAAGIDPEAGITDWDDWMAQMEAVNEAGYLSIARFTADWWLMESLYAGTPNSMTGFDDEGNSLLEVEKLGDAISFALEAQKLGPEMSMFDQGATDLFISDQSAFHVMGPWANVTFAAAAEESGLVYDFVLIPGQVEGEYGGVRGIEYLGITDGPNQEAAWKWAAFLADAEQQRRWAAALGRYVPNLVALEDEEVKNNELLIKTAESASHSVFDYPPFFKPMPANWHAMINDLLALAEMGMTNGEETAREIVTQFETMYQNQ